MFVAGRMVAPRAGGRPTQTGQSTANPDGGLAVELAGAAVVEPVDGADEESAELSAGGLDEPDRETDDAGLSVAVLLVVTDGESGAVLGGTEVTVGVSVAVSVDVSGGLELGASGDVAGAELSGGVALAVDVDDPVGGELNGPVLGLNGSLGVVLVAGPVGVGPAAVVGPTVPGDTFGDPGTTTTGPLITGPPMDAPPDTGPPLVEIAVGPTDGVAVGETPVRGAPVVEVLTGVVVFEELWPPELGPPAVGVDPLPGAGALKISWAGCCS